ncbi:MAG: coatomer subunit gamma, partial [Watsoniomyces obsoletus]
MKCFKRAIELEASNADFWNALGVVTTSTSPRVAQHSFVRSLHLNEHSARTWTNLGALYLTNNDNDLAYDAFTRAQSADPEYGEAWVGQGLLSLLEGKSEDARAYFLHAFEISDSSLLSTKRRYVTSAFDYLLHAKSSGDAVTFLQPLFAIRQLHALSPSNITVSHLMALYAERVGDFESAATALEEVCEAVEQEYEKSESTECLARFAQAKSDLARVQLAKHDFDAAIEYAETALDLSSEDDLGAAYAEVRQKWRLSAHVTAGLAHSHLETVDQSIKMLQSALVELGNEPDVICMLAQVLWAKGGETEKEAARTQLLECIERNESHVQAVCLLAVMGLSDGDGDVVEAVEESLKGLSMLDTTTESEKVKVVKVLSAVLDFQRSQTGKGEIAGVGDATGTIMRSPGQVQGWMELARTASANAGDGYAAEMAKMSATRQMPP